MVELAQGYVSHRGCDHVFFIGFLGAGKTTLAKNLGRMFKRPYVDTDRMAERICRASIAQVFETQGEAAFRRAETQALERLRFKKSLLVSCGGGIVESPENIQLMHSMGSIVFLEGNLEDSLKQIKHYKARPDFKSAAQAQALFDHRYPLYQQAADITIPISGRSFKEVSELAGAILWEKGLL